MFTSLLIDSAIALAPVIGYYSQYNLIKTNKSVGSFSIDVCAILLISNILRIFFWFSNGFKINLLFQSFFIIIIQVMLLEICIRTNNGGCQGTEQKFWRWKKFDSYIQFLLVLASVMTILTLLSKIILIPFYGTVVGFFSTAIESTLGFPQLLSNYSTKSVKGLSFFMIATWFIGDFFKTLYFIVQLQPIQFIMCGTIQLTVDILIVLQIIGYSKIQLNKVPIQKETYQEVVENQRDRI